MDIKVELLKKYIADFACWNIKDFEIDASKIADTVAIKVLREISEVVKIMNFQILMRWRKLCVFLKNTKLMQV